MRHTDTWETLQASLHPGVFEALRNFRIMSFFCKQKGYILLRAHDLPPILNTYIGINPWPRVLSWHLRVPVKVLNITKIHLYIPAPGPMSLSPFPLQSFPLFPSSGRDISSQ